MKKSMKRMILICAGCMWLAFMLGMGINYNRATFAEEYKMDRDRGCGISHSGGPDLQACGIRQSE